MSTWHSEEGEPAPRPVSAAGWLRVAARAGVLVVVMFGSLFVIVLLRIVERPFWGLRRPWSLAVARIGCRGVLAAIGIGFRSRGAPMRLPGAQVANHASWLDIFALYARDRVCFVSKAEVASWPGASLFAKATGTLFIARNPSQAGRQLAEFGDRLSAGQRLLFFPEGTSTDGFRVLPFKSTLFAAFMDPKLEGPVAIQPVSVRYRAPAGADPRFYGWWGGMGFGAHILAVLAAPRQGSVEVCYHAPLVVSDYPDRKALAQAAESVVVEGHAALAVRAPSAPSSSQGALLP